MPGPEHLDVPHVGGAVERPLLVEGRSALVLANVFLVGLAAPRALEEATVRHGRLIFHDGFLRLFMIFGGICSRHDVGGEEMQYDTIAR